MNNNKTSLDGCVNAKIISLPFLKKYLRSLFLTYEKIGELAWMSKGRAKQILNGHRLPEDPIIINRIARGWQIDPVLLAMVFNEYKKSKGRS